MDWLLSNYKLFCLFFIISVLCVIIFTEVIKSVYNRKHLIVWLPLFMSFLFSLILKFLFLINWEIMPFIMGCVFGFSAILYELILKNIIKLWNFLKELNKDKDKNNSYKNDIF